jgi:cytochrome c oxidase subunit 3
MATSTGIKLKRSIWDGGTSPLKASYGKLMMWFFLLSDTFSFSALLITYGVIRFTYPAYQGEAADFVASPEYWPIPEMIYEAFPFLHGVHAPLAFVGLMTFILILSSVTMVLAVEAGHRMDRKGVVKWMLWTIIGGVTFLGCQAWEWTVFIGDGAKLFENNFGLTPEGLAYAESLKLFDHYNWLPQFRESGAPQFSAFFFLVTGFHGFHVLSGVVINIVVYINVIFGTYERRGHYEMVEKVGLYWHFVDLVWVFVFTFFYLI